MHSEQGCCIALLLLHKRTWQLNRVFDGEVRGGFNPREVGLLFWFDILGELLLDVYRVSTKRDELTSSAISYTNFTRKLCLEILDWLISINYKFN